MTESLVPNLENRLLMTQEQRDAFVYQLGVALDAASLAIHENNVAKGFWPEDVNLRNKGECYMLMVSELAEGYEGVRKPGPSDKIPEFTIEEEELADEIVRVLDYSGAHGLRIGLALICKVAYNLGRPHKHGKLC